MINLFIYNTNNAIMHFRSVMPSNKIIKQQEWGREKKKKNEEKEENRR
jgi:hypothetical protein